MPSINDLMPDDGPSIYYDARFRQVLEDHMTYLRQHPQTETMDVNNQVANKHHGDFTGVLQSYNIPPHLHWVVSRLNGFTSPSQYRSDQTRILVPSNGALDRLVTVHRANHKISSDRKK